MAVRDSNGKKIREGDTVEVIKDLKIKGADLKLMRGHRFSNVRHTKKDTEVECFDDKIKLVLKTCFLKRVSKKDRN
jgi:protein PhnA